MGRVRPVDDDVGEFWYRMLNTIYGDSMTSIVDEITLEIKLGTKIEQAMVVAYEFCHREKCRVSFIFNGFKITVEKAPNCGNDIIGT